MIDLKSITESFLEFEKSNKLFEITSPSNSNWFYWSCIRIQVFDRLVESQKILDVKLKKRESKTKLSQLLLGLIFKNPFFKKKKEVLFIGHPRRRFNSKTKTWDDIYCDPFQDEIESNHLEYRFQNVHFTPSTSKNDSYLDIVALLYKLRLKFDSRIVQLTHEDNQAILELESKLEKQFEIKLDIHDIYIESSNQWKYRRPIMKSLLKRLDPKVLCLVVSYGNEWIIETARELGIPTAELQHGTVYPMHLGYHFPDAPKKYFPDYFLSFGDAWFNSVRLPIDNEKIIPIGYSYLEEQKGKVTKSNTLTVVSQPTIAKKLLNFTLEVLSQKDLPDDFKVIYRLHPEEVSDWKENFPQLDNDRIDLRLDQTTYECFSESKWVLGVYSTALIESLSFDCELFLFNTPGVEALSSILRVGKDCSLVNEPSDFTKGIYNPLSSSSDDLFFVEDAKSNFKEFIKQFTS